MSTSLVAQRWMFDLELLLSPLSTDGGREFTQYRTTLPGSWVGDFGPDLSGRS